jgi:hypothetical protein
MSLLCDLCPALRVSEQRSSRDYKSLCSIQLHTNSVIANNPETCTSEERLQHKRHTTPALGLLLLSIRDQCSGLRGPALKKLD